MYNFGKIKNIFNNLMVEAIVAKDDNKKQLFKEYVKAIKNDEVLRAQFSVFTNIENKIELNENRATEFIKYNIESLKKYSKDQIIEANNKLANIVLLETEFPDSYELGQLHEDITNMIFADNAPESVDKIVESLSAIVEYVTTNTKEEAGTAMDLPTSSVAAIAVDKFNDRYSEMNEDEKVIFKTIIESNDSGKEEIFKNLSRECIDLIDESLKDSPVEIKEKLLEVKDRIMRTEFQLESFITDVSKLIELKQDLK